MDYTADRHSPEVLFLQGSILTPEQQLKECQQDRDAVRDRAEELQRFLDGVQEYAFISLDPNTTIVRWSQGAQHLFGYKETDVLGQQGSLLFTPEDRAARADWQECETAKRTGSAEDERWHVRQDGTRFWASGVLTAHREGDRLQGFSKVLRDLTDRKLADDRLRASEEQLRLFSENVQDYALVPVDVRGFVSGWNTGAERTFGYSPEEIVGQPVSRFFLEEDVERGAPERDLQQSLVQGRNEEERWMVRKDGTRFWARWVTTPMYDNHHELRGFAKVLRDETGKKRAEEQLMASLQERDLLLREIHHRVKNNLNVIASLISLQAAQVPDESLQQMFSELQDRVRAVASLHKAIYQSPNIGRIPFGSYLESVLHDLVNFHQVGSERILVHVESEDVVLSVEQAFPLGLLVNELASNALKHAFAGRSGGSLTVTMRQVPATADTARPGQKHCEITVQDDGPGLANPDDFWQSRSMGLRIARLLTEQLEGTLALRDGAGTGISLQFPLAADGAMGGADC